MLVYILLVIGFICLVKGADFFVGGSAGLAKRFHVPSLIIGMTIVAMGTSAPECAVSISAAVNGSNAMAVSNVVGSNMFNLLAVCGICSLIVPLKVNASTLKKEFPFSIVITLVLLGLGAVKLSIERLDGIILLLIFVLFLYMMVSAVKKNKQNISEETELLTMHFSWWKCIFCIGGGLAAIVIGGQLVVDCAEKIAYSWGLSENFIGLTVCAIGTSLPELVTSIVAARKGEDDMAIGNVIGSNIFNILLVIGLAAFISPIEVTAENLIDLVILAAVSVIVLLMTFSKKQMSRLSGFTAIMIYAAYMIYIFFR